MPIHTFLAACALAGCTAPWQALPMLAWPDGDPSFHAARRAACAVEGGCAPTVRRSAAVTADAAPAEAFTPHLPPSAAARADGAAAAQPGDDTASTGRSATPLGDLLLAVFGAMLFVGWRTRGTRDR